MKNFNKNSTFRKRETNRFSDEESEYKPRGDRPRRSPSRFGRGEDRPEGRSPPRFGGRDSGRSNIEMFRTTCDKCGERCEVPFRPTEGKPVYCLTCYKKSGSSDSGRSDSRRDNNQDQFDKINQKLDKIMHMMGIHEESE
jgi:CxxC-x17-CxxC domain-containing protein